MKKEKLFNWAIVFLIVGLTLVGFGVGNLFGKLWEGIIIGNGLGLSVSALVLFKMFRRREAFEKK